MFAESARAKETFGEMNKARIYKGEQQIRGAHPDYKRLCTELVNTKQRRREQCSGPYFV